MAHTACVFQRDELKQPPAVLKGEGKRCRSRPEADPLAREVANLTGESLTEAVRKSFAERLARERLRRGRADGDLAQLLEIGRHCGSLPDLDTRSADEILGYGEDGLPH